MKIGIGGLHIESCTFSPLLSQEADFRILRDEALLASYPFIDQGITHFPLLHARAIPGGPIARPFYEKFKAEFSSLLAAGLPFDGLFLPMHGAVSVEGMEDAEGDFLTAVREVVGPDCFIAASYDLHGNGSNRVMENLDFLSAYRTAPHVDAPQTLERAYAMLIRCLREGIRPHKAYIPVPVLFSGEKSSTEWEPAASLYRMIPKVISDPAVMDASILIGYVWADEPRSSAWVTAFGTDAGLVEAAAQKLAQAFWDARGHFQFGVTAGSTDDCIQIALEATEYPVVISDSGDNPTAGGAGDTPYVLERMLAMGVKDAVFASITDLTTVEQCEAAGIGATVPLSLGGKLDPLHAQPLNVEASVRSLHVAPWTLSRQSEPVVLNRVAVIDTGGIQVIVTERRTPFHRISDFTSLGIDPHAEKIIVVKIGYLEPELKALAAKALLALSPGAANQDTVNIKYRRLRRPMYPFDDDFSWSPRN